MDDECEPEPPLRDGCVRYALKSKVNISPEKRIRLAPKFVAPGVTEDKILTNILSPVLQNPLDTPSMM